MDREILNMTYYKGEDLYSDGEVEDRILSLLQSGKEPESILAGNEDWAVLYHLSDIRHNLLEWYDFDPDGTLLEIGSGCGALTGLFCGKVRSVKGIELSKKRSQINAQRNKNYSNFEIMVGNFQDIELKEKFDYVTLIGVLEYAPSYIEGEHPFSDMLRKVRGYLKPEGKLLLAIENKLGMKYWAGAMEDHTGELFDGLENYRHADGVRTFSRKELEQLLKENGFIETQFYYPVPDYKMPVTVYSDEYLPAAGDIRNVTAAYDRERYELFDEETVYDEICQEGQFPLFSNSFLVIAG